MHAVHEVANTMMEARLSSPISDQLCRVEQRRSPPQRMGFTHIIALLPSRLHGSAAGKI
jgi:hypothetical protein